MMKKMQFTDDVRNIRRQMISWLSIVLIAFLGVTAFLGIGYSADALLRNGSDVYNQANFRDLEVVTTLLLNEDALTEILKVEGVADAEKVWQTSAKVSSAEKRQDVYVISLTERISLPKITEGRLPADPSECAAEERLALAMDWHVGDRIDVPDAAGNTPQFLKGREFILTGIVHHPDHTNPEAPELPYVLVTPDAFDMGMLKGFFMKAEIVIEKDPGINRFHGEYERAAETVAGRIRKRADELLTGTEWSSGLISVADITGMKVFVNDCHTNSSFVNLVIDGKNLSELKSTFSLLFVLVGALVIYATISKMIDEQRSLVGATKALGLYNREIFTKYLFYGVSSTLLGTLLGILTARFIMEGFVLGGYNDYYNFDTARPVLTVAPTLLVLAAGILLATSAAWFACARLLKSTAITLMQPGFPARHRRSGRDKHSVLTLYSRLILRNIRTDLRRVTVTVVSVAGCCALVVIGITLKTAVEGALTKQYPRIIDYDAQIRYDSRSNENARTEIGQALEEAGAQTAEASEHSITYQAETMDAANLLCGNPDEISRMFHLLDPSSGEPLPTGEEGVYIPVRIAETCGLKTGDEMEIALDGILPATVRVAGVYENYIGHTLILSESTYTSAFGETPEPDLYFVKLPGAGEDLPADTLRSIKGFDEIESADADRAIFESATSVVNAVVILFIVLAAVMAGVVLMNLTNMYMLQKKRELTIMRINGFTVRECRNYVLRETILTTILGIFCGFGLGSVIAYRIIRALEQPYTMFERGISIPAWIAGAAVTVLFAVIINIIALKKVRTLNLTDVE